MSREQLIYHGLSALRETLHYEKKLDIENCTVGVVGVDTDFTVIENEGLSRYVWKE